MEKLYLRIRVLLIKENVEKENSDRILIYSSQLV